MKTYAEVIAQQADQLNSAYLNGVILPQTDARVIGFIYGVEERNVEIDIDEEYIRMVKEQGK